MIAAPDRSRSRSTQVAPALILLAYLGVLLWRFFTPAQLFLSYFTDDFFYYVEVARHLIQTGHSTFNGVQLTNGYHPLWLLVIALLFRLFGDHLSFFVAVVLLIWLLVVGSYLQLRRFQEYAFPGAQANTASALLSITFMAMICRTGMEVALALLFLLTFWLRVSLLPLDTQTPRQALLTGLLASALILSRIDCLLIVFFYILLTVSAPLRPRRDVLRSFLFFGAGLLPFALYLLTNILIFGTLLPVSGMVKNLKPFGPSSSTLERLLTFDSVNLFYTWPAFAIILLYLIRWRRNAGLPTERVRLCVALHGLFFYTILTFTSDWFLWTWYLYPLVPIAALLGPELLRKWIPSDLRLPTRVLTTATALFCLVTILSLSRLNPIEVPIYQAAEKLRDFAATHPGRYAMGDRSGTAAYLMQQPVIQLEGLMGDKAFLDHIRHRQELSGVLKDLGVDFYISSEADFDGTCYTVREPSKAGPRSPRMPGRFCATPSLDFTFSGTRTLVFDLRKPPA